MKRIFLISLSFFFASLIISAQSNTPFNEHMVIENLKGYWKFKIGDDASWAKLNFNDSKWDKIWVPMNWEAQGYNGYNGYAWYRKTSNWSF